MVEEISIFNRLNLNNWYKYLLYLGGILLIVSLFSTSSIILSVQRFALYSIVMAAIMWVISEILYMTTMFVDKNDEETAQVIAILYSLASIIILFFWIMAVALPFASTMT